MYPLTFETWFCQIGHIKNFGSVGSLIFHITENSENELITFSSNTFEPVVMIYY